jgi:hypothetical protein
MKLSLSLLLVLSCAFSDDAIVHAFPTAAGSCATGIAVGGSHLTNPTTGSLEEGGFQVVTNQNIKLVPNLNTTAISPTQTYLLNIIPLPGSNVTFRGALIRVEGPGMYDIEAGVNAQEATTCVTLGVGGVTHMSNSDKVEFGSSFSTESEGDYKIEVTVVVANSASTGSIYYYDVFVLSSFEEIPIFPTITPVKGNETSPPADAPTRVSPTAPIVAPVGTPTSPTVGLPAPVAISAPVGTQPAAPTTNSTPTTLPSNSSTPTATSSSPSPSPIQDGVPTMGTPTKSDVPSDTAESDVPSFVPAPVLLPVSAPVETPVSRPAASPTTASRQPPSTSAATIVRASTMMSIVVGSFAVTMMTIVF